MSIFESARNSRRSETVMSRSWLRRDAKRDPLEHGTWLPLGHPGPDAWLAYIGGRSRDLSVSTWYFVIARKSSKKRHTMHRQNARLVRNATWPELNVIERDPPHAVPAIVAGYFRFREICPAWRRRNRYSVSPKRPTPEKRTGYARAIRSTPGNSGSADQALPGS
jgi:hypothetical protein